MEKEIFTAPEIAKICRVSRQTVFFWIKKGYINAFRPAKNAVWKVTKKELIRYMKEHDIPMEFLKGEEIKILVIDDEKTVTRSIERIFHTDERFMLETANSGFSAGTKLEKFKPAIIILDIFLNDMDGHEFFSHIRNHPKLHDTKDIGISGRIDGEEIQSMINRGFNAFLKKPYKINELKETINDILK